MFCCTLLCVHSSIAITLMGKIELVALLNLSSWCLVMVERLFLAVPRGCLRFVIVVFPDHTHVLFLNKYIYAHLHALQSCIITAIICIKCIYIYFILQEKLLFMIEKCTCRANAIYVTIL